MHKAVSAALVGLLAFSVVGCSVSPEVSISQSQTVSVIGTGEKLSEEEAQEVASFLTSVELKNVFTLINAYSQDLSDLLESGDYKTLETEATTLNQAVLKLDEAECPELCMTLKSYLLNAGKAMVVAYMDYSDVYANLNADKREVFNEGNEYLSIATDYLNKYQSELERIEELAK